MAGLNQFIFGNAIAIQESDLYIYGGLAVFIILCFDHFSKGIQSLGFQSRLRQSHWFPDGMIRLTFNVLMILSVVIGIQAIGVVLMAALLITPGAAARFWTDRLGVLVIFGWCLFRYFWSLWNLHFICDSADANWPLGGRLPFYSGAYLLSLCTKKRRALSLYFPKNLFEKDPSRPLAQTALQRN